jgi:hypothetical protein
VIFAVLGYLVLSLLVSLSAYYFVTTKTIELRGVTLVTLIAMVLFLVAWVVLRQTKALFFGLVGLWLCGLVMWSALSGLVLQFLPEKFRQARLSRAGFGLVAGLPAPIFVLLLLTQNGAD